MYKTKAVQSYSSSASASLKYTGVQKIVSLIVKVVRA